MKKISSAGINCLKEALSAVYWYKKDLRSFLLATISNQNLLANINWEDYKIAICGKLVDYMQLHEGQYQADLLKLIEEVVKINDFSHLEKLDGGKEKATNARKAVNALKEICQTFVDQKEYHEKIQRRQTEEAVKRSKSQDMSRCVNEAKKDYCELLSQTNAQERGFKLEKLLKELFRIFDLDPKASFRITGEQIDGAFVFESTDFLFEAKWTTQLTPCNDLDSFAKKIERKLDNTLGLFLSINGYSDDGLAAFSRTKQVVILMDGADLMAVLEERIGLPELLSRKKRHASQTGDTYLKISNIFQNVDKK